MGAAMVEASIAVKSLLLGATPERKDEIENLWVDCPGVSRQIAASRRGPFEGLGTDATQVTMAAGAVVKSFNVVEHV